MTEGEVKKRRGRSDKGVKRGKRQEHKRTRKDGTVKEYSKKDWYKRRRKEKRNEIMRGMVELGVAKKISPKGKRAAYEMKIGEVRKLYEGLDQLPPELRPILFNKDGKFKQKIAKPKKEDYNGDIDKFNSDLLLWSQLKRTKKRKPKTTQ